ncbi:MAG TPA: M20/M25/M40 family metallo-hydrolase [Phnomibacter sp.]|nr:M20/M25/M40 family metallo-hydrolase [Phnomibacter sp.]
MKKPVAKKLLPLFLLCSLASVAQLPAHIEAVAEKHTRVSFRTFYEMLSLPNDAHFAQDIEKNVRWCEAAFAQRGFSTQRLETATVPLLLASRPAKGAKKTVLIYLQIDGQPVDPTKWDQESPWEPVLKEKGADGKWKKIDYNKLYEGYDPEWRIFARAASDAKGPAAAFIAALDALAELDEQPNYHLKVIMDLEEELGSPQLPGAVEKYKDALAADMLLIYDGPRHISNKPTLTFGARGIAEITLTVHGPRNPTHSGNYGNYTPNPAMRLAQLLATMKDDDGRVTLPGFYDGVALTQQEKDILKQVPDDETEVRKFLGIAAPDKIGDNFQESIQYPTLNIRGMNALYVGKEARTLIPDKAVAEIDIRLVKTGTAERLIGLVRQQVQSKGYHILDREPTEEERLTIPRIASFTSKISYGPFQTPFDSAPGVFLTRAMTRVFGKEPIRIRMMGGSIPISPFVTTLGIPAVSVPTVNPDNNQHAENENIRVGNYAEAVRTFLAILLEKL